MINEKRALHSSPPLVLNGALSAFARNWADIQSKESEAGKSVRHSSMEHTGKYGENIHVNYGGMTNPEGAAGNWYSEIKDYRVSGDIGSETLRDWPKLSNQNPVSHVIYFDTAIFW